MPRPTGLPKKLTIDGGMPPISLSISWRASGVGKTVEIAAPMTSDIPPSRPAAMMKASRESRMVLP